jgi:galactose mutarotase-like enzyme
MYALAQSQGQYLTYVLTDTSSRSRLEVVPERGGIVTQWVWQDQQILYLDAERFSDPQLSVRGGIPILFPICGNLADNSYTVDNKVYQLPQHGFARNLPWTVIGSQTIEGASLTVQLTSSEYTRATYPWDFVLQFTYTLQGDRLTISQTTINQSTTPMPFSLGLHPYFTATDKNQLQFTINAQEYTQKDGQAEPWSGAFDWQSPEIDVLFNCRASASVTDNQRGLTLELISDPNYSCLVFWTVQGKDFYCLEPWSAPRNALNTGIGLTTLEPQATFTSQVILQLSKIN